MAYTFTRTGAQIEEIHNTVDDLPNIVSNENLISNSSFEIAGSVTNPPDTTPRNYSSGDELFQGMFAVSALTGVTYINGEANGLGQIYTDVYKSEKQKLSTSNYIASIAGSNGSPVESGASFVDNGDYWRVTFDMNDTFSIKFEQGSVSTRHGVYCDNNFVPLSVSNSQFIKLCQTPNATVKLKEGTYSNLIGEITLTDINQLHLLGKGKDKSLIPYGTTIRVEGATNGSVFFGFGMEHETADQDLGNSPKLLDLRRMKGLTVIKDVKYELVATNPNAGGGGIGIQWLESSDDLWVDDIYTLNASTSGLWAGRKAPGQYTRCNRAWIENSKFIKTVDQGFPTGVNVSEVREVYESNNYYEGYFLTPNRQEATTNPNTDGISPRFYTDVLTSTIDGTWWIAASDNGSGGWNWVQTTASNKCYGYYSGDSDDSSTGIDAPEVFTSSNSKFKDCNYMIGCHWADEMVITNAVDVNNTCDNGFKHDGIESAQSSRSQPRLLEISGGVMPNIFFSKVKHVDISNPPIIYGSNKGEFNGIRGYALNASSWDGQSAVIGPVTIINAARGGIYIDGFERVTIADGYYIENCGQSGAKDINTDSGITIGSTNVDVKYYSIGKGVIRSSDGNMPAGINVWSVRRNAHSYISPNIKIDGYTDSLANTTGIYGALVTRNPSVGQWVGPPFGLYNIGDAIPSQDGRFQGWVCVSELEYGRYDIWDSSTSYAISDRVSYGGWEWEAVNATTGSDPLASGQTDWTSVRIVFNRFGESIGYS